MRIRAKNRTQFTKQLPSMQIALFRQYNHEMSPLRERLTRVNKKILVSALCQNEQDVGHIYPFSK